MRKIILLILLVSYFNSNAQLLKKISTKIGISIFEESGEKVLSRELGSEITERIVKQYNDDVIESLGKALADNPKLKKLVLSDDEALKVLAKISKSKVCRNEKVVSHLTKIMKSQGEEKFFKRYLFTNIDDKLVINTRLNTPNGKVIKEIANIKEVDNVLIIEARQGGKKNNLNDLLNRAELIPNSIYKVKGKYNLNSYSTKTDDFGNVKKVYGTLTRKAKSKIERSKDIQKKVRVKKNGINGDDGGHLIANQFGGGSEMINLIPMRGKELNRPGGEYYKMEQEWAKALEKGKKVDYKIKTLYPNNSKRPEKIIVTYTIEGEKRTTKVFNN